MKRAILVPVLLMAALGGYPRSAVAAEGSSSPVQVSPGGKWIAYVWSEEWYVPMGPEPVAIRQTVYVCWASTTDLEHVSRRRLAVWGMDKAGYYLYHQCHLVFSPDGTKLAVTTPSALWLGDLAAGTWKELALTGETVSSLCWLDKEQIGYVTLSTKKDGAIERVFWKQRFDQPAAQRVAIRRDPDMRNPRPVFHDGIVSSWPQEFWSPNGEHVFFRDASDRKTACLMTVATGEIHRLPSRFNLEGVSWSRDSTRVAWLTETTDQECFMFLWDVREQDPVDLSRQFREAIGKSYTHSFEPRWTPDDRFIVGSNLELGGYLIQPVPWSVRRIGKVLGADQEYLPAVRGQDVENILIAELFPERAVVDYEGNVLKVLGDGGYSGWTVLPGGKQAVCVMSENKLAVTSVK